MEIFDDKFSKNPEQIVEKNKEGFLKNIDEKWGHQVLYVPGKQKEKLFFAYFPHIRKFYGFANNLIKEEAKKKLYEESWEYFCSLENERLFLGDEEKKELNLFYNMLK
ncbi:MAG: hypothetical protein ABH808_00615 [Candidatus Kuenenbacteria bacterium]